MNRAQVWILLCTAVFAAVGQGGEPSSTPAPPAGQSAVPAALLARLRAQYVPEEDKTPDISENDKVRRYEAILREGSWAERQYAQAPNLHEVRELMMAAAKGLATLEGTTEAREALMDIARRLANSSAPPESRVVADMLFLRARIEELSGCPAEATDEVAALLIGNLILQLPLGPAGGSAGGRGVWGEGERSALHVSPVYQLAHPFRPVVEAQRPFLSRLKTTCFLRLLVRAESRTESSMSTYIVQPDGPLFFQARVTSRTAALSATSSNRR